MARSTWTQSNFLGGQWGQQTQGRIDHPDYRKALDTCSNAMPYEEGSLTRRPGTRMGGPTSAGHYAVTLTWDTNQTQIYDLEVSVNPGVGSTLRIWQGEQPMVIKQTAVTSISTASPCVLHPPSDPGWATGDVIMIRAAQDTLTSTVWAVLLNRHISVTRVDATHYALRDAITGASIDGSTFTVTLPTFTAGAIATFALPYTTIAQLDTLQAVQSGINGLTQLFLLSANVPTYIVTQTAGPSPGIWPTFTVARFQFVGPYFPPGDLAGTINATTGTITLTVTSGVLPNNNTGFAAGDVGRSIRLHSQPPQWNNATAYTAGQAVLELGVAYVAITNTTGQEPVTNPAVWRVNEELLYWADGIIQSFIDTTHITLTLGSPLLTYLPVIPTVNGLVINQFTLGIFGDTFMVYPACGAFHEGRLWISGDGSGNEIDGSESNTLTFRPSDQFGNVLDTSAISYPLLSSSRNVPLWMESDLGGLVIGTSGEEWLVFASSNNNVITATNIQAHKQTKYGCFNSIPTRAGMALIFIQRYAHVLFEYLVDAFSQRFTGVPLNDLAKSVTGFVTKVAYVENFIPCVWARTTTSTLVGCTYRRLSRFVSSPPEFKGWHQHTMAGIAPAVNSISSTELVYGAFGIVDSIAMITTSGPTYYKEVLAPVYDPALGDEYAWHLDGGVTGIYLSANAPTVYTGIEAFEDAVNMYFLGVWYQPTNVRVYIAGIDFGTFPVVNGVVTIPYGSDPGGLGTRSYITTQVVTGNPNGTVHVQNLGDLPVLLGTSYTTTIKLLRPDIQEQARTQAGNAVGESRRPYQAAAFIAPAYNNSAVVSVDDQMGYPMIFRKYINGPAMPNNVGSYGIWQDTILADESYDGQLTFTISGPYPFILNNVTPFMETTER